MIFPEYKEEINYAQLSLTSTLALQKQTHEYADEEVKDAYDVQNEIYTRIGYGNYHWYKWWCSIMMESFNLAIAKQEVQNFIKLNSSKGGVHENTWFITIGINPLIKDIKLVVSVIESVMSNDWIKESTWVYENYTEHGEKLHIMAKMTLHTKIVKSVLIQKICRSKGLGKIVEMNQGRSSTYVSVLPFHEHHEDYINLIKTDKKQNLLDQDETFRKKHNLKLKYSTNV